MSADDLTEHGDRVKRLKDIIEMLARTDVSSELRLRFCYEMALSKAANLEAENEKLLKMLREQATAAAPKRKRTTREKSHGE